MPWKQFPIPNGIASTANNIINNMNPQKIQMAANNLWNQANDIVNRFNSLVPTEGLIERVTLLVDISFESRNYLLSEATLELEKIKNTFKSRIYWNVECSDNGPVTIIGNPDSVLNTFLELRKLVPILVWFELMANSSFSTVLSRMSELPNLSPPPPMEEIRSKYDLQLFVHPMPNHIIQPTPSSLYSIYIRTKRGAEDQLKRGLEALVNWIKKENYGNIFPSLNTRIEIPQRNDSMIRTNALNPISEQTSTTLSVQRVTGNSMSSVSIMGSNFSSITSARTEISDRLTIELNFEINALQSRVLDIKQQELERLGDELNVHILSKPSNNPNNRTVMIRGAEKEVLNIFEARLMIMALINEPFGQNF